MTNTECRDTESAEIGSSLKEWAHTYAGRGWLVIPLRPRSKKPLTDHSHKDGSHSPTQIEAWWSRWPDANVGLVCAAASGLLAVDIDPRNGGSLEDLPQLPTTLTSHTGSDGLHL